MKTIRFVVLVLASILTIGITSASAQEYEGETPVEFSAIGMMGTDALWSVVDQRPETKGFRVFATGKYKLGLSLKKGRYMTSVYRFRDNVPTSYKAVVDPSLVREYWGWEGEEYVTLKEGEYFDLGPVGTFGVGWYQGKNHLFSWSAGARLQAGPGVFDAVWDSNAQGLSLRFGLRLK